jgi:hypothetical protein
LAITTFFVRFISVFWQDKQIKAEGFSTQQEAIDFLGWSYEDNDLTPLGIYDAVQCEASAYQHLHEPIRCTNEVDIVQAAHGYLSGYTQETTSIKKNALLSLFFNASRFSWFINRDLIRWLRFR